MKKRSLTLTLAMALALLPVFPFNAFAQKERVTIDAGSGSGAGLSSGMIGITAGQTARLSVWNGGDKAVQVRMLFIDGDGKILILCTNFVASGKSFSDELKHPGGDGRIELHGEIRVEDKQDLDSLAASLQVIDDQTGKTQITYGANDFVRFGPIFNPPGD